MIAINDVVAPTAHPATPFGGRKASGWGVTQGMEGLLAMTVPQVVSQRRGKFRPHFEPPSDKGLNSPAMMTALLQATHAGSWRQRLAAVWRLIARS
jgi:aldehyde dehydrogenase (NAD+)